MMDYDDGMAGEVLWLGENPHPPGPHHRCAMIPSQIAGEAIWERECLLKVY